MFEPTHARMIRPAVLVMAVCTAVTAAAQSGAFTINGRVKVDGGTMDGVKVVVMKNGAKDRVLSSNLARFTLDLDLNASYILSFEKEGFVTKKLSFDTHAPADAIANGFTPFEFAVSIFKQYDDVSMVVFNQPVGMIRYEPGVDDFDYDTDYTKSIQTQLQETLAKVEEKQKEEARNAGETEKARAKAEAEAQKAAAAKAAEEERLKKEQAAAAAKAEADRKKQEAEAQKAATAKAAEEERLKREQAAAAAKAEADRKKQEEELARRNAEEQRKKELADKAEQERTAAEARKAEEQRKRDAAAKAEAERKGALATKEEERPAPAPPPVVKKEQPPPPKPAPPVRPAHAAAVAAIRQGEDARRSTRPVEGSEESAMREATSRADTEDRPSVPEEGEGVVRNEELIVEPNQVITVIHLETDNQKNEYRKVVHKYGAVFYFKNGGAISQVQYESEALAERR